jgi:formyltetrahydrofolate-dependent phosphoribosylglycinamide formyltransferase
LKIAVFVSGRGSNLKAILDSPDLKFLINVVCVVSDKNDCQAFSTADQYTIKTFSVGKKEGQLSYSELSLHFSDLGVELIVLAGFLKLIPPEFIGQYENRIINIHPALLPSFGSKGMYGPNVHKAVFDSSAKVSGATVHFVDTTYDTGKIIAQRCIDISDVESPVEIAERVLTVEHKILPEVIKAFAEGRVKRLNNRVIIT